MDLFNTYFYTATILDWIHLLKNDNMKNIVVQSLEFLVSTKKVRIYAFIIMENHVHLIWGNVEMNGKEFPDESFLKFTGHQFKKELKENQLLLEKFHVNKTDRKYQF